MPFDRSQDSFFLKRRFQSFKLAENVDLADLDAVPDTKVLLCGWLMLWLAC